MSRFHFRLQAVLRVRQLERDECQHSLSAALDAERQLAETASEIIGAIEEVQQQMRGASLPGGVFIDGLRQAQRYATQLEGDLHVLRQREARVKEDVQLRHERLVDANRAVRVLEKLRHRQIEEYRRNQTRLENRAMDEFASTGSLRRECTS